MVTRLVDNKYDKDVGKHAKGNRLDKHAKGYRSDKVPRCYYISLEVFTAEVVRDCQHWPALPRSQIVDYRGPHGVWS